MNFRLMVTAFILSTTLTGCSSFKIPWQHKTYGEKTKSAAVQREELAFSIALQLLKQGKTESAKIAFEQTLEGERRDGITDEALFRLALLQLPEGKTGLDKSINLLEILITEYPDSIWAHQGMPVFKHLKKTVELNKRQKELKTLKEQNYSLTRDNREMRQNIERFKILDLELEKNIRRMPTQSK